jgi:hypothetical protein
MATQPAMSPETINAHQSLICRANSVRMTQQIYSNAVSPATQPTINIPVNPVGLVLGFMVVVSGTVANASGTGATRTDFGSSNALSNITYTDINNVQRINTSGKHIALLNTARQGFGFGGAYAPNLPMNYGNNWAPFAAPATLAASATGTVRHTYYVPLAYAADDLRGAVYAAVIGASQTLQVTINNTPFVGATDPLNAIYTGNSGGAWSGNVTVTVYQIYRDQLPTDANGQPILPIMDLNTIYDIKNTTRTGMTVGQDFPVAYANYRQFLSTIALFDNGGTFNVGSDVTSWALITANSAQIMKIDPNTAALLARQTFMADPPPGTYYFDHRDRPIDTITYGNQQLVLNASTVNANAQLILHYEAFQITQQIPVSSSLPAG